ncbi:hypothetical protein [uncultured Mucilaginibacter sp.]|uniref:hypothetical protein n=1 Tax=uncultured Mucilaginibacter sp. TaxID=797541 RepID=UPI0025D521A8|nr:hypothetical protein [uncultured Mucilaginibacter sp.]
MINKGYFGLTEKNMRVLPLIISAVIVASYVGCRPRNKQEPAIKLAGSGLVTKQSENDTVTKELPDDAQGKFKLLTTGTFHHDEVAAGSETLTWYGLFKSKHGRYFISPAQIKIKQVKDDMVDEGVAKTGWEVTTDVKDTCFFLLSGYTLSTHTVERLLPTAGEMISGQVQKYQYNDVDYTLAAGGKKALKANAVYPFTSYRLHCSVVKSGISYNDLLVAHSKPDYGCTILFVGDVDGDSVPDLLVDTSGSENVMSITLYLSKPAEIGKLFKHAGTHTITGC